MLFLSSGIWQGNRYERAFNSFCFLVLYGKWDGYPFFWNLVREVIRTDFSFFLSVTVLALEMYDMDGRDFLSSGLRTEFPFL